MSVCYSCDTGPLSLLSSSSIQDMRERILHLMLTLSTKKDFKRKTDSKQQSSVHHTVAPVKILISWWQDARAAFFSLGTQMLHPSIAKRVHSEYITIPIFPLVFIPRVCKANCNKSWHPGLTLICLSKLRQSSKCPWRHIKLPYIFRKLVHWHQLFTALSLTDTCWFCDSLSLIRWRGQASQCRTRIIFLFRSSPAPLTGRSCKEEYSI